MDTHSWARRLRAAGGPGSMLAWTETATVTAGFLGLCLWLRPWDPFFLASLFPWTWLAPILMALRHGSKSAILSSLLLVLAWESSQRGFFPVHGEFPKIYFLGGFIATLFCGEFRDLWQAEIQRERKVKEHLEHRLSALSRSHLALSLSHDRLQAGLLTHPPTLRDALTELRGGSIAGLDATAAQGFLTLLARYFQLETGAIHLVGEDGPDPEPLAALGPIGALDGEDAMVRACLETGKLCHAADAPESASPGRYLFAAPMETGDGGTLALLVAGKMPFFAFHEENLRGLFAVSGYFADVVAGAEGAAGVTARFPDCPPGFAAEYLRLHRLGAETGLESSLAAAFPAGSGTAAENLAAARQAGRSLDLFWLREIPGQGRAVIALLPFCGASQALVFLSRLEGPTLGGTGPQRNPQHRVSALGEGDPVATLDAFLAGLGRSLLETAHG